MWSRVSSYPLPDSTTYIILDLTTCWYLDMSSGRGRLFELGRNVLSGGFYCLFCNKTTVCWTRWLFESISRLKKLLDLDIRLCRGIDMSLGRGHLFELGRNVLSGGFYFLFCCKPTVCWTRWLFQSIPRHVVRSMIAFCVLSRSVLSGGFFIGCFVTKQNNWLLNSSTLSRWSTQTI